MDDDTYEVLKTHQEILENHTAALRMMVDSFKLLAAAVDRLRERVVELEKAMEEQDQGTTD